MRPDSTIHWNTYPALLVAGCLGAGVLAAHLLVAPMWVWITLGAISIGLGMWFQSRDSRRLISPFPLVTTLLIGAAVVSAGAVRMASFEATPAGHISSHVLESDTDIRIEGRIADHPVVRPRQLRMIVDVDSLAPTASEGPSISVSGRIQATLWAPWGDSLRAPEVLHGDRVQLTGRLEGLPRRRNPADFDYGRFLARQGVHAVFTVRDSAAVMVLRSERSTLEDLIVRLRSYVRHEIETSVPSENGQMLLTALLLGDRTLLDSEVQEQFRRTGLMHLLAVSGLHVLLVGMVIFQLLGPLLRRFRLGWYFTELARASLTLTLLGVYMLVAGASVSVVRAVVMAALLIGGIVLQRSSHTLNTLGVAAVVLLLMRPTQLFDVGFQLSFAAVAAIVVLQPRFREFVPQHWMERTWIRGILLNVVVSFGAVLGTLPVLLYHFGYASLAGIVLNVIAIPLTAGTLLAGLICLFGSIISASLAGAFGTTADLFAGLLLTTTALGDRWMSVLSVERFVTSLPAIAAITLALVALAQWPRPRNRWRLALGSVGCVVLLTWMPVVQGNLSPKLDLVFLDVGHGDAVVLKMPSGQTVLVDAGERNQFVDRGRRTLLPHLQRYGIREIDTAIISHPHADHYGGLPSIAKEIPIGRVIYNGQDHPSALFQHKMSVLDSLQVPLQKVTAGDTLRIDSTVQIDVLAPEPDHRFTYREANDASIVFLLTYGSVRILFTGDAERSAEEMLVDRYGEVLESTIVKVGHHGSATSSTPPFVSAVAGNDSTLRKAIVSVGTGHRYGLPSQEVVDRWESAGARVLKTPRYGAVWLQTDGDTVWKNSWR